MTHFDKIKKALEYIDRHFGEPITLDSLAQRYHFSSYYFHRLFSAIVGKNVAAYIRERRLVHACLRLSVSDIPVIDIALDCGFGSAQAFSRAFRGLYGMTPSEYRRQGIAPVIDTAEELIMRFTNRLKGGIFVNPRIIKQAALYIAGVSGDGNRTGEVWGAFEKLCAEHPLPGKLSENGYEIRVYEGGKSTVHVGYAVSESEALPPSYTRFTLPASTYASFDVYVANGYDSENNAMNEWLASNEEGYTERLLVKTDDKGADEGLTQPKIHYCVEFYDERFHGEEAGSIVEIWIPVQRN